MIISISISNKPKLLIESACLRGCLSAALLAVTTSACAAPTPKASAATAQARSAQAILSASFEKAVLGKEAAAATEKRLPRITSFGMKCTPSRIASGKVKLTIALPQAPAARRHAFAVITPAGQLYELYSPYSDDVEVGDIIIPSEIISWQKARTRAVFSFAAADLMASAPKQNVPIQVFQEAGLYKFALVSSIQKDLIAVSDTPGQVKIFAGCVIDWVL